MLTYIVLPKHAYQFRYFLGLSGFEFYYFLVELCCLYILLLHLYCSFLICEQFFFFQVWASRWRGQTYGIFSTQGIGGQHILVKRCKFSVGVLMNFTWSRTLGCFFTKNLFFLHIAEFITYIYIYIYVQISYLIMICRSGQW